MKLHSTLFLIFLALLNLRVLAQNDYLLPFALQASVGKESSLSGLCGLSPTSYSLNTQEQALVVAGAFSHTAFIKENGLHGLSVLAGKDKNYWSAHYSYQGYAALHRQKAALGYARNLFPGFGLGVSMAYGNGNAIENRKATHGLQIGLSAIFKRGIWAVAFQAEQDLNLSAQKEKIWNRALFMRLGVGCRLYKNLHFGIDLYKDLRYALQGGLALSYQIEARAKPMFAVYAQARINPYTYKLGFAYTGKRIQAGISLSYQHPVGLSSCIGIALQHLFPEKRR